MNDFFIFLDIDGVLNSSIFHHTLNDFNYNENNNNIKIYKSGDYVEVRLINELNSFIDKISENNNKVKIILISSWVCSNNLNEIISFFNRIGILNIIDKTDYTGGGIQRAYSILKYIKKQNIKNNYIVIDDSDFCYNNLNLNFLKINGNYGFVYNN